MYAAERDEPACLMESQSDSSDAQISDVVVWLDEFLHCIMFVQLTALASIVLFT